MASMLGLAKNGSSFFLLCRLTTVSIFLPLVKDELSTSMVDYEYSIVLAGIMFSLGGYIQEQPQQNVA